MNCYYYLTGEVKKMNLVEAIRSALDITLQKDPTAGMLASNYSCKPDTPLPPTQWCSERMLHSEEFFDALLAFRPSMVNCDKGTLLILFF